MSITHEDFLALDTGTELWGKNGGAKATAWGIVISTDENEQEPNQPEIDSFQAHVKTQTGERVTLSFDPRSGIINVETQQPIEELNRPEAYAR